MQQGQFILRPDSVIITKTGTSLSQKQIIQEASTIPRFLFRIWREKNDDARTIDSKEYVTPTMLKDLGRKRPAIYEVPLGQLLESAKSHLQGDRHQKSYFSVWTHSWRYLIQNFSPQPSHSSTVSGEMYISIIDTKLLEKRNVVVLHSSYFNSQDQTIPNVQELYLAHGIISGHGDKIVSLSEIVQSNALSNISVGLWPHYTDLNEAIHGARLFGACYGKYFALPVAVTLLSFPEDRIRYGWTSPHSRSVKRVLQGLWHYQIPRDWIADFKTGVELPYSTPDSNRAKTMLEILIDAQHPGVTSHVIHMDSLVERISSTGVNHTQGTILDASFASEAGMSSYHPSTSAGSDTVLSASDEDEI